MGDNIKMDPRKIENVNLFKSVELKGRNHMGNIDVDAKITLRSILK
jgi:hypothetical protein